MKDETWHLAQKGRNEKKPHADFGGLEHVSSHGVKRIVDMSKSEMRGSEMIVFGECKLFFYIVCFILYNISS